MEKKAIDFKIVKPIETEFSYYEPFDYSCSPNLPATEFPIDLSKVDFQGLTLTRNQEEIIKKYGFALSSGKSRNFSGIYPENSSIPFFLTTDFFMHAFHTIFDTLLKKIEIEYLIEELGSFLHNLMVAQMNLYDTVENERLKIEITKNIAFLATIQKLLNDEFNPMQVRINPKLVLDLVSEEISNINRYRNKDSAIFGCTEDFSKYKPRGHYAESKMLKKYFQAMMYAGRMSIRYEPNESFEINSQRIRRALLLISSFDNNIWEQYHSINSILTFLFGDSDNITALELDNIWKSGGIANSENLANNEIIQKYVELFKNARAPKVNAIIGYPDDISGVREFTLFGQKFTFDSYIFQELVYDKIKQRYFPKALDIFAVFGNDRARELLKDEEKLYPQYSHKIRVLREEFGSLTAENWTKSLYNQWIYTLLALDTPLSDGYPSFMKTQAWKDKSLVTSLGSWTELRNDTILYTKEPMGPMLGGPRRGTKGGYVEPNPEFYARLSSLLQYLIRGLEKQKKFSSDWIISRFQSFLTIIKMMLQISIKELECEPLTEEVLSIIKLWGGMMETEINSAVVADVFTDSNEQKALEEGVGFPMIIYVVVPDHLGNLRLTRGAIYSHYEFKVDYTKRLSKEEWRNMLDKNPPETHEWVRYLVSS